MITGNLTTTFLCCKAVLPHMVERRSGAIINLTSPFVVTMCAQFIRVGSR